MSLSVAVAGASGYAGGELLRLLSSHPEFEVTVVTANQNAGQPLSAVHPHLVSLAHLVLQETTAAVLSAADVVFLALPHGGRVSSPRAPRRRPRHRLRRRPPADVGEATGRRSTAASTHGAWTYGLPELVWMRWAPSSARACPARPGSPSPAATSRPSRSALAPGIAAGVIEADDLVAVLAVGTSGAGKSLRTDLLASEIAGSAAAYQVGGVHRHTPEILQNLEVAGGEEVDHLVHAGARADGARHPGDLDGEARAGGDERRRCATAWESAYADEPFVHVLPAGVFPRSGDTTGANTA